MADRAIKARSWKERWGCVFIYREEAGIHAWYR